ncbi:hypothetical protein STEG23_023471 [Scotinomys teguina]
MTDSPATAWTTESVTDTFSSSTVTVFSAKMESDRGDNTCGTGECHTNLIPLCTLDSPDILNTGHPGDLPGVLLRHKNSSIDEDREVNFKITGLEFSVKAHTDMKTPPLLISSDHSNGGFVSELGCSMTDSPVTTWTAESVTDTFSSSTVTVFSAKMESDRGDNTCGNRECHTNLIPLCTLDSPEIMNTGYPGDRPGHLLRHKNSSIGEDKEVYFKIPGLEFSVKPHTDMKTPPLVRITKGIYNS